MQHHLNSRHTNLGKTVERDQPKASHYFTEVAEKKQKYPCKHPINIKSSFFHFFSWNTSTHLGYEVIKPGCLIGAMLLVKMYPLDDKCYRIHK